LKFLILVEGHLEKRALPGFFKRWLDLRLDPRAGIRMVRFEGWRDYYSGVKNKVVVNLDGRTGADTIAAIGLIDLYGPDFYPSEASTAEERYRWAKHHLEEKVGHPRFRQHFAVHETEAWLLASPEIFPKEMKAALRPSSKKPEAVNFQNPPAALLDRMYVEKLKRRYRKIIDGSNLFDVLQPDIAYQNCPYLKRLLDDMLLLAQGSASSHTAG